MKSGMLAAEAAYEQLTSESAEESAPVNLESYETSLKNSWIYKELWEVRNVRPSFHNPLGNWGGMLYSGIDTFLLKGRGGFTLHNNVPDHVATNKARWVSRVQPAHCCFSFSLTVSSSSTVNANRLNTLLPTASFPSTFSLQSALQPPTMPKTSLSISNFPRLRVPRFDTPKLTSKVHHFVFSPIVWQFAVFPI